LKPSSAGETAARDRIAAWVDEHPSASFLDPEELSYASEDISVGDLAAVLRALVETHELVVRYKVKSPFDQSLTDKTFDEPYVDVDVYDQSERLFNTRDGEFIPVFIEPEDSAHE
jgi:hypothetical protein